MIPALCAIPPVILYFAILSRGALNIPNLDDYDTILDFLNKLAGAESFSAKFSWLLASQNSEFKLIFLHFASLLQCKLSGHVDFALLSILGNLFPLLLAYLAWRMLLTESKETSLRIGLFLPVPWLIFQIQYWDDLDWATPGFQHLAGLVFSLAAIFFLTRKGKAAFCVALAALAMGVASDGDGLVVIPIGLLILAVGRRFAGIFSWSAVSAGCMAVYKYGYHAIPSPTGAHRSLVSVVTGFKPLYVLACMGGAVGLFPQFVWASVLLGAMLLLFFLWMLRRGYFRRNPAVCYCMLFLVITVAGVAGLRGDLGIEMAVTSRYTIYSAALLVFAWIAAAEEFFQHRRRPFLQDGLYLAAVSAAVLFSLVMDMAGSYAIAARNKILVEAMTSYEHPTQADPHPYPSPFYATPGRPDAASALQGRFLEELTRSIELGIYKPPKL